MIGGFGDSATADVFHGVNSKEARRVPKELWEVARRKLDMLNSAHDIRDLRIPPANHLEPLKGRLAGKWSIRINDQFRIVFRFEGGNATDVRITDYH